MFCVVLYIFLEISYMGDSPGTTSQENPFQGMSFVSPPCGDVGPPFMATFNLPGLTIGLPLWLFSNIVIPNALFVLDLGPLLHALHPEDCVVLPCTVGISKGTSCT